jgi:hypothetical protein
VAYAEHVRAFVQDLHAIQKKARTTKVVAGGAAIAAGIAGRVLLGEHGGRFVHRAVGKLAAHAVFSAITQTFGTERHFAAAQANLLRKWDALEKALDTVADELDAQAETLAAALYGYFISQAVISLAKANRKLNGCDFENAVVSIGLPPLILTQMNDQIRGLLVAISRSMQDEKFMDAARSCDVAIAGLLGDESLAMTLLGSEGESYLFDFLHLRASALEAQIERARRAGNVEQQLDLLAQLLSVPPVIGYSATAPASALERAYWRAYVTLVSHETAPIALLSVAVRFAAGMLWQADNLDAGARIPGESGSDMLVSGLHHTSAGLTSLNVRHPLGNTVEEGYQILASRSVPKRGMAVFRLTRSFADRRIWQSKIGKLIRKNAFYRIRIALAVASVVTAASLIGMLVFISSTRTVSSQVEEPLAVIPSTAKAGPLQLSPPSTEAQQEAPPGEGTNAALPADPLPSQEDVASVEPGKSDPEAKVEASDAAAGGHAPVSTPVAIDTRHDDAVAADTSRNEAQASVESNRTVVKTNVGAPALAAQPARASETGQDDKDRALALQTKLECSSCTATAPVERLQEWSQLQRPAADAPGGAWVDYYVLRFEYINRHPDLPLKGYLWQECRRLAAAAQRYANKEISYDQFAELRAREDENERANLRADELRRRPAVLPSGPAHVREHGASLF